MGDTIIIAGGCARGGRSRNARDHSIPQERRTPGIM
jgi:hypothetical protein